MLFTDLNQYIVLGALLVIGWLFGFASHPGGKKWRVRYDQESEAYAAYRHDSDSQLRDNNRRIAELERERAALAKQLADAKAAVPPPPPPAPPPPPPPPVVEEAPPATADHDNVTHDTVTHESVAHEGVAHEQDEPAPAEAVHAEVIAPPPAHTHDHAHPEQVAAADPAPVTEATSEAIVVHHDTPAEHIDHAPVAAAAAVPADPHPVAAEVIAAPATEEPKKGWFDQANRDHLARIRGIDGYMQTKLEGLGLASFSDIEKLSAEDEMALEQRLEVPVGYIAREQWRDQAALLRAGNVAEHNARFGQI